MRLAQASRSKMSALSSRWNSQSASSRPISPPSSTRRPKAAMRQESVASMDVALMVDTIPGNERSARVNPGNPRGGRPHVGTLDGQPLRERQSSKGVTGPFRGQLVHRPHRQHDVVFLFIEFEDQLDAGELIRHTEVDGRGRADEIHPFGAMTDPRPNVFEVEARLFLLQKYSHRLLARQVDCLVPLPRCPG